MCRVDDMCTGAGGDSAVGRDARSARSVSSQACSYTSGCEMDPSKEQTSADAFVALPLGRIEHCYFSDLHCAPFMLRTACSTTCATCALIKRQNCTAHELPCRQQSQGILAILICAAMVSQPKADPSARRVRKDATNALEGDLHCCPIADCALAAACRITSKQSNQSGTAP